MPLSDAWEDAKRVAQNAFNDLADSYQDRIIRGHLWPTRDINIEIAADAYGLSDLPLINPEQDVSNTEIDEFYRPER